MPIALIRRKLHGALLNTLMCTSVLVALISSGCSQVQNSLLYFPTHRATSYSLVPWVKDNTLLGFSREVAQPRNVWLMLHGNAGQAADRIYAIAHFSPQDSVYILEYPGYGMRPGSPSRESIDNAAEEAYLLLRKTYPNVPIGVVGESIGSGPASWLAGQSPPPDKLVLITPFDVLSSVARDHYPGWMVSAIMRDDWDNAAALAQFKNPIEIYGARADRVIPVQHAKALAAAVPTAKLTLIDGDHNDWSASDQVRIDYLPSPK